MDSANLPASKNLKHLLYRYYRRESELLPEWARTTYDVGYRVERNLAALENRRIFPVSFLAREIKLKGARVLDAGCGTGQTLVAFAEQGAEVIGLDLDRLSLNIALRRALAEGATVELLEGNVTNLQFPDGTFDVIVNHQVLEHLNPRMQSEALDEMWRVLKCGGILFIQTPNRCFPVDVHDSQLPFAHWLPAFWGRLYARLFRRIPPHNCLMNWTDIARTLRLDRRGSTLINQCDMYHSIADFREHHLLYTSDRSWRSRAYFSMVTPLFRLSRLLKIPYAALAPNLNLLLRK